MKSGSGRLTNEVKMFVVQALACFDTPSVVAASATKEFGISLTRQHVEKYDPTKKAGANLSATWRAVFEETRKDCLASTKGIAVSHKSVRLRSLERMFESAEIKGDTVLMMQLLEQAAREVGYQT